MTDVSLSDMLDTSTSSSKHNGVLQNVHVVGADGDYCSVDGVLCRKTEDEMLKVRNLGKKSLEEVEQKLAGLGLTLRASDE